MNSPIQQPINERECPGAPLKDPRSLNLCLIGKETKRELFPDNENENLRPTTPPPRDQPTTPPPQDQPTTPPHRYRPNGICYCPLDDCKCHYAPMRVKKSNN